jgi:branched-chain amino acid aminotransferase
MILFADPAANRAFRYGDGVFESIRTTEGEVPLWAYHWRRLCLSAEALGIALPKNYTHDGLFDAVARYEHARVRLTLYRVDEGRYAPAEDSSSALWIDGEPLQIVGCSPDPDVLQMGVCPEIRLPCDAFSHLKSCSALRYVVAARYRQANGLEDCFLLNVHGRVAEASSSNVFAVLGDGAVATPPLSEGCVAGVMRAYVLDLLEKMGLAFREQPLSLEDLSEAREIFLTNAVRGLRSVGRFGQRSYETAVCTRLKSYSPV